MVAETSKIKHPLRLQDRLIQTVRISGTGEIILLLPVADKVVVVTDLILGAIETLRLIITQGLRKNHQKKIYKTRLRLHLPV